MFLDFHIFAEWFAEEYSETFAENQLGVDVELKDTTPIYDAGKNIVGYSVAFEKNNTPYGYVNVDTTKKYVVKINSDSYLAEDFSFAAVDFAAAVFAIDAARTSCALPINNLLY